MSIKKTLSNTTFLKIKTFNYLFGDKLGCIKYLFSILNFGVQHTQKAAAFVLRSGMN
jgi:hypothetical protein